ncbi:MAG: class I SAM-dependent methyltransferase [Prochlorothrix sp.]
MDDYQLLIDLHRRAARQGPGGEAETEKALNLAGVDRTTPLKVADIGCGTGASALVLARLLKGQITAVDFLQDFLTVLEDQAQQQGLADKITTLCCSMAELPFSEGEYDLIWSEGAIYNIGFERGIADWRRYLKPGGVLVVSEITWIRGDRPGELQQYWEAAYPEIDVASAKIRQLEEQGYSPIGYFVLPEYCWLENYYRPMQAGFEDFLDRNGQSEAARDVVAAEVEEMRLYEKYKDYYSYGVYLARKLA